ncbi:zinc finger protein 260 [Bicyclus anynana]|uniref:Zinc finger protein 260 n=1 Tax=Bicyclus anynana TaxID=110368 RepID=A0A6J1NI47_BICAN|nr:zinc finger protein 260 [Bicyclus anynana]
MERTCQTCLAVGVNINPMSFEDIECYRLFITKIEDPLDVIYICFHCKAVIRKLRRFIRQSRLAYEILKSSVRNSELHQKVIMGQLSTSDTICHYIGPESDMEADVTNCADDNEDDIPLVMLSQQNCDDMEFDNDAESDNVGIRIENIKQEETTPAERRRNQKRVRKKKKEVREGFSSRMVTETDEYKVIKLTKEQILEEMRLHSQSDKYKVLPYKCETCVRGFNFEDVLQTHMEKHSPKNGDFQCDICTQYCPSRVSLRGHMKSHSTRYKCKLCGLVRLSRQHILEHHSLQHTGSPALYTCPKCDHTTNKRTAMQRHVRLHAAGEPLRCHCCGKLYKSKESLRIHVMRHDDRKLHQCQVCSSTFIYAAQLSTHMRAVHELRDYYCVECDIMFKSMNNLKQHLQRAKRHRDDSSYKFQCQQCEQKFISASTLATHNTNAHGAARSEACDACPRAYSSAEALRWHTRRAHGAAVRTTIPCPLCDRQFSRKYVLRVHMRSHTGERPHACGCGAAFAQPAALRAHTAQHHKVCVCCVWCAVRRAPQRKYVLRSASTCSACTCARTRASDRTRAAAAPPSRSPPPCARTQRSTTRNLPRWTKMKRN